MSEGYYNLLELCKEEFHVLHREGRRNWARDFVYQKVNFIRFSSKGKLVYPFLSQVQLLLGEYVLDKEVHEANWASIFSCKASNGIPC